MIATRPDLDAVLFDADGVLQKRVSNTLPEALAALLPDSGRADHFVADVFSAEQACFTGSMSFRSQLEPILKKWQCSVSPTEALRIWQQIQVDGNMLDMVSQVRSAGFRVGLATNQWVERAYYMSSNLRYQEVFDALFFSCEIGAAKPDLAFFGRVLSRFGVTAGRVLFIDDREANVQAAASVGLEAAVFKRHGGPAELFRLLSQYGITPGSPNLAKGAA